jgi:hypothetical protein
LAERGEPEAFLSPLSVGCCSLSIIATLFYIGYIVFVGYGDGDHILRYCRTVEIVCHGAAAVVKL